MEIALSAGVELFRLGTRQLAFSPSKQILLDPNATATFLLEASRPTTTYEDLVEALVSRGSDRPAASHVVDLWLTDACESGLIEVRLTDDASLAVSRKLSLAGYDIELKFEDRELCDECCAPYQALPIPLTADLSIRIIRLGSRIAIAGDGVPAQVVATESTATRLRHTILTSLLNQARQAALHSACLIGPKGAILICGSPGAGKSTLTLSLLRLGWHYGGDDVAFVNRAGQVRGLPLPVTVKEGSWPIAQKWVNLSPLQRLTRDDGAVLKYWPVAPSTSAWTPVRALIRLHRGGAERPQLTPWEPTAALQHLFAESFSRSGTSSADDAGGMISLIQRAECLTLSYTDAWGAAEAITERHGLEA